MNMEYSSCEELEVFNKNYSNISQVINNAFDKRGVIYNKLAIDYQASLMEKELDILSGIFNDKKNVLNLVALKDKEGINGDVLRVIYDFLVSGEGFKRYSGIIDTIENCKDKNKNINTLELNAQILEV